MEFKKFYKTQDELGETLKNIIDLYYENDLSEEEMMNNVYEIITLNNEKYYSRADNTKIASRVRMKLGKNRLELISKILEIKGES